jgi:hypothetical protein
MSFGRNNPIVISRGASPLNFARPAGPGFPGGHAAGIAEPVPQHVTIGFPPASNAGGYATPGSRVTGSPGDAGWRPITPIRGGDGALGFSGQGHEIWQDNGGQPANQRSGGSSSFLESRPSEGMRPHPFPPRRFHGGPFGPGYGYGYGYGYGFGGFYPYGFGLGFGFGAGCDPLWDFGCGAYGYPGYGYYGPLEPGFYLNSYSGDDNEATAPDNSQNYGVYSDQSTTPDNSSNAAASNGAVLYLNDGTSFAVTDYWVADYKLHYVTEGARENEIDLDQIDVQRTVDENAARGVNFTLKPAPGSAQE